MIEIAYLCIGLNCIGRCRESIRWFQVAEIHSRIPRMGGD